jgi:hypothetical protein
VSPNLSPPLAPARAIDPRLQRGAYITDGEDLYFVERVTFTSTSLRPNVLVVEDCRTNAVLELDVARAETMCKLVRAPASPRQLR